MKQANVMELLLKTKIVKASRNSATSLSRPDSDSEESDQDVVCLEDDDANDAPKAPEAATALETVEPIESTANIRSLSPDEAHLISLVSTYLVVHPFGASLCNIHSYLKRIFPNLGSADLEESLKRYTNIFCESSDAGEPSWKFIGYELKSDEDAAAQSD